MCSVFTGECERCVAQRLGCLHPAEKKNNPLFLQTFLPLFPVVPITRHHHLKIFLRVWTLSNVAQFSTNFSGSCRCPFSRYIKFFLYSEHLGAVYSISLLLAYPVLPPTLARIKCLTLCPPLVTAPVATN